MPVTYTLPKLTQPFVGLRPFAPEEHSIFFGREVDCDRVFNLIRCSRLHVIYAPSAFGKSSLLRAGVMPRLSEDGQHDPIYLDSWSEDPIEAIRNSLTANSGASRQESLVGLAKQRAAASARRPVIILDQAEELSHSPADAEPLWRELASLANSGPLTARIVVSVREDHLGTLTPLMDRVPGLMDASYRLARLTAEQARACVLGPINAFNQLSKSGVEAISIEPALVDEVLNQVRSGRISLAPAWSPQAREDRNAAGVLNYVEMPFLQLVMNRIWEEESSTGSRVLRLSTLRNLGEARSIVENHFWQVINRLSASDQALAAELFRYLITPSGTKVPHAPGDLAHYTRGSRERVKTILEELSSGTARILRAIEPAWPQGEPRYEILNDILVPALQAWTQRQVQKEELAEQDKRSIALSMSTVVHEIKRPLQSIIMGLHYLRDVEHGSDRAAYVRSLEAIEVAVAHLRGSFDSFNLLRSWAANEERGYKLVASPLQKVVMKAVDMYRMTAIHNDVRIVVDDIGVPLAVRMDEHLLLHAFANILDNAVKYSFRGREIRINYDLTSSAVSVSVLNYGIGVTAAESSHLFQRGFRGREASSRISGMGLGLFIANEVVTRHYGKITLSSWRGDERHPDSGFLTRVVITLPLAHVRDNH